MKRRSDDPELRERLISSFHLFFGLPTALYVLYFVLSSGFHPAAFLTHLSSCQNAILVANLHFILLCVLTQHWILLFSSVPWLHECFSSCIQSILLIQSQLLSISSSVSFMVLIAICVCTVTISKFIFRASVIFFFFLSIFLFVLLSKSLFQFCFIFVLCLLLVFSFCLYDEAEHFVLRRLNHSFVFF